MAKGRWVAAFLLTILVMAMLFSGVLFYLWKSFTAPPELSTGTVLSLEISGHLAEGPTESPLLDLLREEKINLFDVRQALGFAAKDPRIHGVLLEIGPLSLGWGAIEELRGELLKFRASKKPAHALLGGDFIEEREYYLATSASQIVLNPEAGALLNGLLAEVSFYRKALDKLRIEPQFIQYKEYKNAAEPFSREHMSPYFREALDTVLTDIQGRFVHAVSTSRKLETARILQVLNAGLWTAPMAQQQGLVDQLGYRDEVEQALAAVQQKDKKVFRSVSVAEYLRAARDRFTPGRDRPHIGLVFATGVISSGKSEAFSDILGGRTVSEYLRKLRKDEKIKAIVVRVDSPGGSAVGSDMVWREIRLAREAKKPVVVSMSSVAGSGGYYISMAADAIVAQPSAITGSIGVVFGKLNLRRFFEWLGINVDQVKKAENADMLSGYSSLTPGQEVRVRLWMEQVYEDFVNKVARGRNSSAEKIEAIAKGRIWTGLQAKERGLVDELGGMEKALEIAKQKVGIKKDEEVQLVIYPRKKTLWEALAAGELPLRSLRARLDSLVPEWKPASQPQVWLLSPEIRIY